MSALFREDDFFLVVTFTNCTLEYVYNGYFSFKNFVGVLEDDPRSSDAIKLGRGALGAHCIRASKFFMQVRASRCS